MTADEVQELRRRLGLTQEQMAHELGVSWTTVSRWENGHFRPSGLALQALRKLASRKIISLTT